MPRKSKGAVATYPPAPWHLGGWGIATVGLVDVAAAAATVPAGARIVNVVANKTIGGLVFASYERGPLVYHELCVVAGLVRVGRRFAFWLPRLYVDSPTSLAGGREIWGVRKELATFEIGQDIGMTTVAVRQGAKSVCRLRCSVPTGGLRVPLRMPAFGLRSGEFLFFTGHAGARMASVRADVAMGSESEFTALGLDHNRVSVRFENLSLVVPAPVAVRRGETRVPAYGTS